MLKNIVLCVSLASVLIIVNGMEMPSGTKMLGPGKWFVLNLINCEDNDGMPIKFDISRHKIDRTHDGFDLKLKLDETLDSSFGIRLDICKFVDGGCKPFQVMTDESAERFIKKYSKENLERLISMAGIQPPDFPIPLGSYQVDSFVFNYEDLPDDGLYGRFGVMAFLVKDARDVACLDVHVRFTEEEDEDEEKTNQSQSQFM